MLLAMLLAMGAVIGAKSETDLEKKVADVIGGFKEMMPAGRADIGIPVLDPAVIKTVNVNIKVSPFNAKCIASNVSVAGASDFTITKISQIEGTNKVSVGLEIAEVNANGQYDLKGKVKVGFINVKLNSQGPLRVNLKGLKGEGTADLIVGDDGSLSLNSLQINEWSYKKVEITLGNLAGGGVIGKTVNKLINTLVPTVIKSNRNKINALLESKGKLYINKYLNAINGKPQLVHVHLPAVLEVNENDWDVSDEAREILHRLALTIAGSNSKTKSSSLVDRVLQLLEDFRTMMPNGRSDINIPVLDPAVIHRMPVDVKLSPFDFSAVASEVAVSGVSAFIINKMEQIEGTNQLSVSIEVPEVDVDGQYEINGKVTIGFFDVNLSGGKGPVTLKMKGFKGTATADMIVNADGTLNLNWIRFDTWKFDEIKAELGNVFMAKYVNPLINKLIPLFLEVNRGWINNWGTNVAKTVVNRYLDDIAGKTVVSVTNVVDPIDVIVLSPEVQAILDQLAITLAAQPRLA